MRHGVVKWFNEGKGFGFIESEGKDFFVHFKEIQKEGYKSLSPEERVTFVPGKSPKGDTATNVHSLA